MSMRARLGAAPRAARNWGLVRPLLPAWPGAPAVVFLAFLTRPTGGIAGEWPSESPHGHPSHHATSPGTEVRPRGRPPVTQPPQGGLGPEFSQYRPICTRSLPRHPRAPPARAAHPRRPLAPPVRAARSRSPLAPSARAATSPHRHRARHRTLMVSLGFPIPSHLHTPLSCLQRALLRGRLGHARRASTSGAQGIVRAGATSRTIPLPLLPPRKPRVTRAWSHHDEGTRA